MSFVQNAHVVQACTANTPDQPLNIRILPRTAWGDHDFLDPQMLYPLLKRSAIGRVAGIFVPKYTLSRKSR
jgi:hypothetical protein